MGDRYRYVDVATSLSRGHGPILRTEDANMDIDI